LRFLFEWDDRKAKANLRKHQVPFERAVLAFEDPLAITIPDEDEPERWRTTGIAGGNLLVIVHTDAEETNGETEVRIRIISARRATKRETRDHSR
jgi:uncharacterized DUF497 family protein